MVNITTSITTEHSDSISTAETWGFGLLFVTLISLTSVCGAFVIPFRNKKIYKKILMALIGVAVGSLSSSGILHLMPEALEVEEKGKVHVWIGVMLLFGIYLFYLVEKILNMILAKQKLKSANRNQVELLESTSENDKIEINVQAQSNALADLGHHYCHHSHDLVYTGSIAPVAWMIILGDGLHNFIDGLSIGAAFTDSLSKGISISLAVVCEEFPHELGDFAILVNAGMTYKQAMMYNFLSACCCYVGLIVGILVGGNLGINRWIYALAGGMFLYISLCGMLPELDTMGNELERDYLNEIREESAIKNNGKLKANEFNLMVKLKIMFLQNFGIMFGFSIMLILALYGHTCNK